MKKNLFFVFLFAVLLVLASGAVSAAELVEDITVKINGNTIDGKTISVTAGEEIDIDVSFDALKDEEDVVVKVWIEGYRDDVEDKTERFDIYEGATRSESLSLDIPLDVEIEEDYKLIIRVASKNEEDQERYQLKIQRASYELEILSVEYVRQIDAGDNLQINVVVKNRGSHEIEDIYIKARIPDLNTEKRVYAGDLAPEDCGSDCEDEDAVEKSLLISIPEGSASGEYLIKVMAYNEDSTTTTKDIVTVEGVDAEEDVEVLSAELTKEVEIGGVEIYKIEILNPSDEAKTITITTSSALEEQGISIKATPEVIIVPAESSQEVELEVETSESATTGSYTIPVEVSSEEEVIKQVGITANVVKVKAQPTIGLRRPLFTSAVVLAIILVVLVIVLFVTVKKPAAMTEEETAYY